MQVSLHFQALPGWAGDWATRKAVTWVKLIDPPLANPLPMARVVGRTFMPDAESNALIEEGKAGALKWFERWRGFYEARSYIHAWEGPNEPQPMDSGMFRRRLAEFTAEWNDLMHRRKWKTVAYNLSVGWPDKGQAPDLKPGLANADYFGLHEYSAPSMESGKGWYCLRYRNTVEELGGQSPPILITECGIDGGVMGQPQTGWKSFATADQYLEQLEWYGIQCAGDNVAAAFVFTAGPLHPWWDFEVDEQLVNRMTVRFPSIQPQPAPIVPPVVLPAEVKPLRYPFLKPWPVSSSYADHLNRKPPSSAPGMDIAAPAGRPIRAPIAGKVANCYWRTGGGRSLWIVGPVYKVYLAHMSQVITLGGETVRAGDMVGLVGSTGQSTGPHLHMSVQKDGKYVNPEPLLRAPGG